MNRLILWLRKLQDYLNLWKVIMPVLMTEIFQVNHMLRKMRFLILPLSHSRPKESPGVPGRKKVDVADDDDDVSDTADSSSDEFPAS